MQRGVPSHRPVCHRAVLPAPADVELAFAFSSIPRMMKFNIAIFWSRRRYSKNLTQPMKHIRQLCSCSGRGTTDVLMGNPHERPTKGLCKLPVLGWGAVLLGALGCSRLLSSVCVCPRRGHLNQSPTARTPRGSEEETLRRKWHLIGCRCHCMTSDWLPKSEGV